VEQTRPLAIAVRVALRLSQRGKVVVVGAANSGGQIAQELSATHWVELSVGQRLPAIPQRPLGRDI
jgi:cation diffusion facilitator CzcD-associated flavoprotein CzcO